MSHDAAERLVAGRWTLHTALRRGPAGVIWQATDADGRPLAVEELRLPTHPDPGDTDQAALWDRVAAEARAAASLDHPALVRLDAYVYGVPPAALEPAARARALAMRVSDAWVADGCRPDDPRIRSERPAFDEKFPELAAGAQSLAGPPEGGARPLTGESDGGATYREDLSDSR